jgi:hypothetical protein
VWVAQPKVQLVVLIGLLIIAQRRIPTVEEYLSAMQGIEPASNDIYQYLNFDQISQYQKSVGHIALDGAVKKVTLRITKCLNTVSFIPVIFGKNQKRPIRNLHNFLNF